MSLNKNVLSVITGKLNKLSLARMASTSKAFRDAVTAARKRRSKQRTVLKATSLFIGRTRLKQTPMSLRKYADAIRLVSHLPKTYQGYHPRQRALTLLHQSRSPLSMMGSDVYGNLMGAHILVRPNYILMSDGHWTSSVFVGPMGPHATVFRHP